MELYSTVLYFMNTKKSRNQLAKIKKVIFFNEDKVVLKYLIIYFNVFFAYFFKKFYHCSLRLTNKNIKMFPLISYVTDF